MDESGGDPKSSCFHTCLFKMMGLYGSKGINKKLLKSMLGAKAMIEDSTGWKKKNADKIMDSCLSEVDTKAYSDCSEDLKTLGLCFFAKMFMACPGFDESKC